MLHGEYEPFEPVSKQELEAWLPSVKPGEIWYVVETKGGEKIGQIVGRLKENHLVKVGYRIILSERNRGYCTDAILTLVGYLFRRGEVERVGAEVNPRKTASQRVLEKAGFKEIAMKEKVVEINGVWMDGIVYELTCIAWRSSGASTPGPGYSRGPLSKAQGSQGPPSHREPV